MPRGISRYRGSEKQTILELDTRTKDALAADVDDYDLSVGACFVIGATGTSRTIKGIAGGIEGRMIELVNVLGYSIYLQNEATSSVAGNRILTALPDNASFELRQNGSVLLSYNNTVNRWVVMHGAVIFTPETDTHVATLFRNQPPRRSRTAVSNGPSLTKAETLGIASFDTSADHSVYQDVTGGGITPFSLPFAQSVLLMADGTFIDDGSDRDAGKLRVHVTDSASNVTTYESQYISGGNDLNASAITLVRLTGVLPAGSTTIKLQAKNQDANDRVRLASSNIQAIYMKL